MKIEQVDVMPVEGFTSINRPYDQPGIGTYPFDERQACRQALRLEDEDKTGREALAELILRGGQFLLEPGNKSALLHFVATGRCLSR